MNFLADENIDDQIVIQLRQDGHDVIAVVDMEPGISDDKVLALANDKMAILLTGDKDFGEFVFRQCRQGETYITHLGKTRQVGFGLRV